MIMYAGFLDYTGSSPSTVCTAIARKTSSTPKCGVASRAVARLSSSLRSLKCEYLANKLEAESFVAVNRSVGVAQMVNLVSMVELVVM